MTKYIYPVSDRDGIKIEVIIAKDLEQAKEKIVKRYFTKYEELNSDDFDEMVTELAELWDPVVIGEVIDIETL